MRSMIRSGGLCRAISLTVMTFSGVIALVISVPTRAHCGTVGNYIVESWLGWQSNVTPYVLDDTGWGGSGTQVCIWPWLGGPLPGPVSVNTMQNWNQVWQLSRNGQGIYTLQPDTGENLCLDNRWNQGDYGNPVQVYTCNGTLAQRWYILGNLGTCRLVPEGYPWMALDVPGSENYPGNLFWIWGQNGTSAQNWSFTWLF